MMGCQMPLSLRISWFNCISMPLTSSPDTTHTTSIPRHSQTRRSMADWVIVSSENKDFVGEPRAMCISAAYACEGRQWLLSVL